MRFFFFFFLIFCRYLLIPASFVEKSHWMILTPLSKISLTHVCGLSSNTNTAALEAVCSGTPLGATFLKKFFHFAWWKQKVFLALWAVIFFFFFTWLFPMALSWPQNFPYIHVLISKTQGNSLQVCGALLSVVLCLMNYSHFGLPSLWTLYS